MRVALGSRRRAARASALIAAAAVVLCGSAAAAVRALHAMAADPPRAGVRAAGPLFTLRGLKPGDRASRCVDGGDRLAFFGEGGENSALAPHLRVRVFDGCRGDDLLYDGTLARGAGAIPGRGDFRVEVEVLDGAPQAATARSTFALGQAPVRCTSLRAPGGKIVRSERVGRRVSAKLILRTYSGNRIGLTTGLRVRGKTLRLRDFATVTYRVNGGRAQRLGARPFRFRTRVTALHSGRNVVAVTIRARRRPSITARFPLQLAASRSAVCEVIG